MESMVGSRRATARRFGRKAAARATRIVLEHMRSSPTVQLAMAIWLVIGGLLALPVWAAEPRPRNPLNALQAYRYLEQICELGPRISGSPAMASQQAVSYTHLTLPTTPYV